MIIVKIGGGKNANLDYLCEDIALLSKKEDVVLVHGASVKRDEVAQELGHETKYIHSPSGNSGVYTDAKALDVLTMVYAGLVNKQIVARLQQHGVNAVGLSGADGRIWEGTRKKNLISVESGKSKLITDTHTGKVEKINTELITLLVQNGYLPVITQPAISYDAELINTDNDRNIAVMAGALNVDKFVVLFEAPGLLQVPDDETTLVKTVSSSELESVMNNVSGRMKKKVMGAKEALDLGVKQIFWGDSRIKNPIQSALKGLGTTIS